MDYLFGLRLVIALSVVGLAVMIGAKACQLNGKTAGEDLSKDKTPQGGSSRQLKEDFWSTITGN